MTKTQLRAMLKNTALNSIRKIYSERSTMKYSNYADEGSYVEQRDQAIREIILNLERDLKKLNTK